jgi:hypothetical protein
MDTSWDSVADERLQTGCRGLEGNDDFRLGT